MCNLLEMNFWIKNQFKLKIIRTFKSLHENIDIRNFDFIKKNPLLKNPLKEPT